MDSFHNFIFEIYRHFNSFLNSYYLNKKEISSSSSSNNNNDNNDNGLNNIDLQNDNSIDFYNISVALINILEYKRNKEDSTSDQQQQNNNSSSDNSNNNNSNNNEIIKINNEYYLLKFINEFRSSDLLDFILCLCFFSGNEELAKKIISNNKEFIIYNIFINKNFKKGIALAYAIPFSSGSVLRLIANLTGGTELMVKGLIDNSYIMTSALYGNLETLEFIIEQSNKSCLNYRNSNGDTAMLFAAMNGDNVMIEKLLEYGEDILCVNNHGFNVFICAAFHNQSGTISMLSKLIERKFGIKKKKEMIDHKNKDNETPLHIASRLGFEDSVRVLLENNCEINIVNKKLQTPLDLARKILLILKKDSNYLTNSLENISRTRILSFKDELLNQNKLPFINSLLPDQFKENVLFSKPNLSNMKRDLKNFTNIIELFQVEINKKEKEIEKNLKQLLLNEKKLKIDKKQQNQQQQQQQQQKKKTTTEILNQNQQNQNQTEIENQIKTNLLNIKNDQENELNNSGDINNSNSNNSNSNSSNSNITEDENNKTTTTKLNSDNSNNKSKTVSDNNNNNNNKTTKSNNNKKKKKNSKNSDGKKEESKRIETSIKTKETLVSEDETTTIETTTVITPNNNISPIIESSHNNNNNQNLDKISLQPSSSLQSLSRSESLADIPISPQQIEQEQQLHEKLQLKIEQQQLQIQQQQLLQLHLQQQLQRQQQHFNQKSYKEEYTELANIYLEQSLKYKEMMLRLSEIENYFSEYNKALYDKNSKAEALGLGIAEILGLGLEHLSTSQLTVLEGIHKDSIERIIQLKQNLK